MTTGEGAGGAATSPPKGHTRLRLSSQWDATATYESLDRDGTGGAAPHDETLFVGRSELVSTLESAIGQPDRRGTYLISGYRGAGKTSLVVEAARRARQTLQQLSPPRELLMLVLNV